MRPRSISARGFKALKIRFHREHWRADIKALEAVQAASATASSSSMVDCNQELAHVLGCLTRPGSLKEAVPVARELERLGVYWMEEPLHRADREGMRRLREMVDIHIAGGEMTRELYEFRGGPHPRRLPRRDAARRRFGGRHHRPAPYRAPAMAQENNLVLLHAAHLDQRHGRRRQLPSHSPALQIAPFVEFPLRPAGMEHQARATS